MKNVVIVGGGIAGLAASIYLARAGRSVTVFEKRRSLGGRAFTHLRRGFRFNLGSHTFYRGGPAAAVCRELGIPIRGGGKRRPRGVAMYGGQRFALPSGWWSLIATSLLSVRGKRDLAAALFRIRKPERARAGSMTLDEWLSQSVADDRARDVLRAIIRTSTLSDHSEEESAALALAQLRSAMRGAVYIDEGWQKIVDSLHSAAISSGVSFVTSSRVVGVEHDGTVRAVELGGLELDADRMDTQTLAYPETAPDRVEGARLPAGGVILAVDPTTARSLTRDAGNSWSSLRPVTAACLDVALRSLPDPRTSFVVGIDEPIHLAAHSTLAQLTPKGGALIHAVRYQRDRPASEVEIDGSRKGRDSGSLADEQALEEALDRAQPGWRELVVHRRFLPAMTVTNALATPSAPRPGPRTDVRGLYIAGDWVGEEGVLSDAAFASARAAAHALLSEG